MFEILGSSLPLSQISKKVGQVDARTKVVVVDGQALLVVLHALLEVLGFFVAHTQIVERVGLGRAAVGSTCLQLDSFLQ